MSYVFGGSPRIEQPPELENFQKLLAYLELSEKEFRKICASRSSMYHEFKIQSKKKSRKIFAPQNRLKHLQNKLMISFEKIYKPRSTTHGFIRNRSIVTNATVHASKRHILNLDLKSFFPSITEKRVFGLFSKLGFSSEVSNAIAKICTHFGSLPQGAPTSPIISNMICFSLDRDIHAFSKTHRLTFTRYADDISFSTNGSPTPLFESSIPPSGKLELGALSGALKSIFKDNGFDLNEDKIHFSSGSHRKIVTGLIVNEFPNVPKQIIGQTRAVLFKIKKDGYAATEYQYKTRYARNHKVSLHEHLRGKINHIGNVRGKGDPVFRSLADKFNECFTAPIVIEPTPRERLLMGLWIVEWSLPSSKIDELYAEAQAKNLKIDTVIESGTGTAFFLEEVGLITAEHCAPPDGADFEYFRVFNPSNPSTTFDVKVAGRCRSRDVCILSHDIPADKYQNLKANNIPARGGDIVRAYGFTDYRVGDDATSSPGEVSHIVNRSGVKLLNLSFKVSQGMSGGPILDHRERVVGVVHKGGPAELRDYGVAIEAAFALKTELQSETSPLTPPSPPKSP